MSNKNKKSRKKFWVALIIVLVVLFIGIPALLIGLGMAVYQMDDATTGSSYGTSSTKSYSYDYDDYDLDYYSASPLAEESVVEDSDGENYESTVESTETRVIKTGTLYLTVDSTQNSVTDITKLVQERGGFVQDSYTYTTATDRLAGEMTLRVPSDKFEGMLEAAKAKAKVVTSENVSGQDVTEDYIDLQSRLKSLQSQEAQYSEILKQATTVEDILDVTSYLNDVREDIEVVQGRINYLDNKTDLATITIYLSEKTELGALTSKWQPSENVRQAYRAWVEMLQSIVDGLVWLFIFLGPPALIIYLIVKLILWRVRKKRKKKN